MPRPESRLPVRTIDQLVRAVTDALIKRHQRAEWEAVLGNWETGQFINAHILQNRIRAERHAAVYDELSRRTDISQRLLYQCAQFARLFPYLHHGANMGWSHYRLLCQVEDDAARSALLREASRRHWTAPELEQRVRQINALRAASDHDGNNGDATAAGNETAPRPLTPKLGQPGVYPVAPRPHGGLGVDLGFKTFLPLSPATARALKVSAGAFVRATADGGLERDSSITKADLYTYRGTDVRVVDGDTIGLTIELPPYNQIDKKLRLRGLNCPELDTAAGRAARQFAQRLVAAATGVLLTTTKPDKYDRYLADVFLEVPAPALAELTGETAPDTSAPAFLNNLLLAHGHADRYDGKVPAEWKFPPAVV